MVKHCLNKFKENGVEASLRDNKGRGRKAEITDDDITCYAAYMYISGRLMSLSILSES